MMGLSFDDIEPGMAWQLGTHLFSREEIIRFAKAYDPQPFHVSDEGGAASSYGRLIASGWHTAAAWMRCFVDTNQREAQARAASGMPVSRLGPSPGLTNLKWLRPVGPGDAIGYRLAITGKRPLKSRPEWGLAEFLAEGDNQSGERVFAFDGKVLVARR
jgi:acyl dehydratase